MKILNAKICSNGQIFDGEVTVEHLFFSMLEEGEGIAIRLLIGMKIDIETMYDDFSISLIKKGKNSILNNISDNIENNLTSQVESIEKIDKYTQNWSKYYEKKDFTNMERQFNKIQKELEKVVPLESFITKARQLENIHNLIKNNGKNFNLTQEELELANKLV